MTSSQRAEITHSFFKRYMSKENSLMDFVTRFERALAHIRHNELDKDHKDVNERPNLKSMYPMESTMSELYTIDIFYMFQDELFQNTAYKVIATNEDDDRVVYAVHRIKGSGSRVREVVVDKSSNHVRCSCKMFEYAGIPCRHMLAYFSRMQIDDLPNEYILRRWTKSAKAMRVRDDLGSGMKEICDTSLLERRNRLFQLATTLIDEAVLTEDTTEFVEELLSSGQKKLCDMKKISEAGEQSAIQVSMSCEIGLKEPFQVRAKGCGKRLKGGKEKAAKKARRCHGCGLTGQSHDKRNCPKLLSTSSQNARFNDEDEDDDGIEYADDCPMGAASLQHQIAVVAEGLSTKWMNREAEDACWKEFGHSCLLAQVRAKVDNRSGVEQVEETGIAHWNELQHT
ncbi:hypothetical protein RHSIM_Rhsim03G0080800 [Rhododendron simsii]|uniref:Protein FAR1-RELATED SEQUENCE n=1 Tax=Rhododendron simsii TaxID=118357 RepID=A0A834H6T4_RHOSS|nr:hypothetical protein RHSIM_Rhsim03G0080800 [Rhododendron simsii]